VPLRAVASYDPEPGDGREHDERLADATDGDASSYWTTETYRAFTKSGVGIVLEPQAGGVSSLTVRTDTPGFTAEIRAGDSPTSFDETVAAEQTVKRTTTFELDTDRPYLVLWITSLDGRAHVNEITARS
jgi:hypothetical protein